LKKTREYLKLNYKYPEYSIGFGWVLHARCGYKFDVPVAKAAKMIEDDYSECVLVVIGKILILGWNIGFLSGIISVNFG